jgi:hypothetical protein
MSILTTKFGRVGGIVRSNNPLDDDQIMRAAPSVFAESAHESRSSRYAYIPTINVVNGLRKEGFQPFFACQAGTRVEGKHEFTKHMLRFRHAHQINGAEANEIILINSHDGTSSYQMLAGCFRFVCQNGLICGDTVDDIRVKHSGKIIDNVIEGAFSVLDQFERVDAAKETMKQIELRPDFQHAFTRAALTLKYDDEESAPIEADQLNLSRRFDDRGSDLWKTFNRVQENIIRGGITGKRVNGRRRSSREVKGVSESVRLNRALWTLAESMAGILTGNSFQHAA